MTTIFNPFAFAADDLNWMFFEPSLLPLESAWIGHIPFAAWVIAAAQPRVVVELGTHSGASFAAFCDAVKRFKMSETRCFAVDTWTGDAQAGFYSDEVYHALSRHVVAQFGDMAVLKRMSFDATRDDFADGSVDLLHIDGYHTYEAVRHDFETWRSKLSPRGVVLFHDTNERVADFGVWRYWAELRAEFPGFEFLHSHGLGVLAVGKAAPVALQQLCKLADPRAIRRIQVRFEALGRHLETQRDLRLLQHVTEQRMREAQARLEARRAAEDAPPQGDTA